jgi:hypothetical protein
MYVAQSRHPALSACPAEFVATATRQRVPGGAVGLTTDHQFSISVRREKLSLKIFYLSKALLGHHRAWVQLDTVVASRTMRLVGTLQAL